VADGSASRMVPDGKSPKVTGGADLSINSRGYNNNRPGSKDIVYGAVIISDSL